jgi:hypothetical protein
MHGDMRNVHTIVVGKPEGKRPIGEPRRGWEDNIQTYKKLGSKGMDWVQ